MSNSKLFQSFELKSLELKNRVVMAPLTRSRAINNIPNDLMAEYYRQRSEAGLIITEGTSPSANGLGYPRIPGVFTQEQINGWKKITDAIHEAGSKVFMQIMHVGRVAHEINLGNGGKVVAPTTQVLEGEMYTDEEGPQPHTAPKLMTIEDIKQAKDEFVRGAKNAIMAGFDGVEIHAANGYLIEQFINAELNELNNEYGGSIENRSRFLLEVSEEVAAAIGKDKVGVRLSPHSPFNHMPAYDSVDQTYAYIAENLGKQGIAYVHLVDHSSTGAPAVPMELKNTIRDKFKGTTILNGGYDKSMAENHLESGDAHLIAFGRPFISNPDLVTRMKEDAPMNEMDASTLYMPGAEGYTDYPMLKEEEEKV
ncbi:alkene reductase [Fulvivirga sp. RKSG066]|uniref:alkene reductase n=1 Tax=Fulvivirga aurantia TaxID=2529383 RepID=UPI0012BC1B1E|nr:alkene reductase [Fulvivirga aurantia]MTI20884.1 alkene reductase [Fulvivirga aurantia]